MAEEFEIRSLNNSDRPWVRQLLEEEWGSAEIVTRGRIHRADELPGFVAMRDDKRSGLVTCRLDGEECEIISLNSLKEGIGIGAALIGAVRKVASDAGCRRLWLITSNDNTYAIGFYQKRGFTIAAIYPNSIAELRKLKPTIPLIGLGGIPLRDEIEMQMMLI